jgi:hypothetical protein
MYLIKAKPWVYFRLLADTAVLRVAYASSCVGYKYVNVFIPFYLNLTFIKGPVYTCKRCFLSRGWILWMIKWKRIWRKRLLSKSKYHSGIIVEELRTSRKGVRWTNVTGFSNVYKVISFRKSKGPEVQQVSSLCLYTQQECSWLMQKACVISTVEYGRLRWVDHSGSVGEELN